MSQPNTDDFNKIRIYRVLSKVLLENGVLYDSRYKQILYIYAMYSYQYIGSLYKNFNDHELLKYVNNDVDRFVIEFKIFNEAYRFEEHISIETLQSLLYEYPRYAKAIKLIIEDLQEEMKETEELKKLRNMFLDNIENMINVGEVQVANSLLTEYLSKFDENVRVLNIQGILLILDNKFEEADLAFKRALSMDFTNEDTIHNINYLKVKLGDSYCIG